MDKEKVLRDADATFDRVSRTTSVSYGATHATKPNTSPSYKSARIRKTYDANVQGDVMDAKAAIKGYVKGK